MKKESLTFVIVLLGLLMWYSNTDLFLRLETLGGKEMSWWRTAINTILALGYSTLTAICVRHLEDYKFVKLFGMFDGIAIFLHFQSNIPANVLNWCGSIFYACLMFFLVSMIWKLSDIIRQREKAQAEEAKRIKEEKERALQAEKENAPKALAVLDKPEKTYDSLKSLNGAIARGSESIEYYFNRATPDVQAEYLMRNPNITIQ